MSSQNEAHGDEDFGPEPSERDLELALEEVVECILEHGQYPVNGRVEFDLYDFLDENYDASHALELLVAAMSSGARSFAERIERERKAVEKMLIEHLTGSNMVAELAEEYAAEDA